MFTGELEAKKASPILTGILDAAAERVLRNYLTDNAALCDKIEFSEKQIEITLGEGVTVNLEPLDDGTFAAYAF